MSAVTHWDVQPVQLTAHRSQCARPDWVYASLASLSIVGFPLVSIVPVALGLPNRPISIAFRLCIVALALLVTARLVSGRASIANRTALACFGTFATLLVLRIVWEATVRTFPLPLVWEEVFAYALLVSLLPALALLQTPDSATLRLTLAQIEVIGAAALLGLALLGIRALGEAAALARLATEVINPASIGYLALTVFLVVAARLFAEGRGRPLLLLARVLVAALAFVMMIASATKGPILALLVIGVAVALASVSRGGGPTQLFGTLVGGCLLLGLFWVVAQFIEDYTSLQTVSRFTGVLADPSTADRTLLARSAFEQFSDSPLIGSDLVERTLRAYPHNVMLEALLVTGVVGFLPFLLLNLLALRAAWRLLRGGHGVAWVGMLHLQYQVAALLAGSLVYGSVSWAALILPIAAERAFDVTRAATETGGS